MIAVVDYDTGNLRSVENALRRAGGEFVTSADIPTILAADRILLPGVGEASSAMAKLRERGLDRIIPKLTVPVLGICIGLQLLCRSSEEGGARCLGVFDTDVRRLPDAAADGTRLKVPHVGWNTARCLSGPLFDGLDEGTFFYYVHSYAADLCDAAVARTSYGRPFAAALCRDNFYATQFHPEKSGAAGARLLRNFLQR